MAKFVLGGVAVVAVLLLVPALIPSLNPFDEETVDRSQPALLKSLENLSEYRAATANLQVVVDVEEDTDLIPSFVKGERTLFVAAGSVDAAVDFSGLSKDDAAVRVSDDRRSATITLPAPTLSEPRIEPDRTRVYDRDRGILDRVEDALSDRPGDEQPLYQLAEEKLTAAAENEPQLRRTAERNTRAMLDGMLRGLGFEQVDVRFAQPVV
ncbi:MAG TPA: DUF4230 domain-containing protein [Solirubrobacteraceae bacterium]|nr:DUF4230 domain-containing protein [Solirubrobacteraceae bacterium]